MHKPAPSQREPNRATADSITPPPLGALWPSQGGVYLGAYLDDAGKPTHLIGAVGPEGETSGLWGEYGLEIEGCSSLTDGLANTKAMAAAGSEIATWALGLEADGHRDFCLPALNQLAIAFINGGDHFAKKWHWSSTQYSATYAWFVNFANGGQYWNDKDDHGRVRAVRSFPA